MSSLTSFLCLTLSLANYVRVPKRWRLFCIDFCSLPFVRVHKNYTSIWPRKMRSSHFHFVSFHFVYHSFLTFVFISHRLCLLSIFYGIGFFFFFWWKLQCTHTTRLPIITYHILMPIRRWIFFCCFFCLYSLFVFSFILFAELKQLAVLLSLTESMFFHTYYMLYWHWHTKHLIRNISSFNIRIRKCILLMFFWRCLGLYNTSIISKSTI